MYYVRYPLRLRQVEDIPHEWGIDISYETIRFGGTGLDQGLQKYIQKKRAGLHSSWCCI